MDSLVFSVFPPPLFLCLLSCLGLGKKRRSFTESITESYWHTMGVEGDAPPAYNEATQQQNAYNNSQGGQPQQNTYNNFRESPYNAPTETYGQPDYGQNYTTTPTHAKRDPVIGMSTVRSRHNMILVGAAGLFITGCICFPIVFFTWIPYIGPFIAMIVNTVIWHFKVRQPNKEIYQSLIPTMLMIAITILYFAVAVTDIALLITTVLGGNAGVAWAAIALWPTATCVALLFVGEMLIIWLVYRQKVNGYQPLPSA